MEVKDYTSIEHYNINVKVDWDTVRLVLPNKQIVTFEATTDFEWEEFISFLTKSKKFNEYYPYDWKFRYLSFSAPYDLRSKFKNVKQGESFKFKKILKLRFGAWGLEYLRKHASRELARFHWKRIHKK